MNFLKKIEDKILERQELRDERRAEKAAARGNFVKARKYEERAMMKDARRNNLENGQRLRQEEHAMRDLQNGDVSGYLRRERNVNKIENRQAANNLAADINNPMGGPVGPSIGRPGRRSGYIAPPPVVPSAPLSVGAEGYLSSTAVLPGARGPPPSYGAARMMDRRADGILLDEEIRAQERAAYDRATGDAYLVAAAVEGERVRELDAARNFEERVEEDRARMRAIDDLERGNIGGYVAEEMRADRIRRERRVENALADVERRGYGY